jgi:hypothetical protein
LGFRDSSTHPAPSITGESSFVDTFMGTLSPPRRFASAAGTITWSRRLNRLAGSADYLSGRMAGDKSGPEQGIETK